MDSYTVLPPETPPNDEEIDQVPAEIPHTSPFKKLLPVIVIVVVVLFLLSGVLFLIAGKRGKAKQTTVSTPATRPTATPFIATSVSPTIVVGENPLDATDSGKLAFIKEGTIYERGGKTSQKLVAPTPPAADLLRFSGSGAYLAWRGQSTSGIPTVLGVYTPSSHTIVTIQAAPIGKVEVVDYVWAPHDDQLALLTREKQYVISLQSMAPSASDSSTILFRRDEPIRQILWPQPLVILFSGSDGIGSLTPASTSATMLMKEGPIVYMKTSPDGKTLLYVRGNRIKNEMGIMDLATGTPQQIALRPSHVDMGNTAIAGSVLEKGFLPYALWLEDSKRLLVGYQYRTDGALIGIYDIANQSFRALGVFPLLRDDVIISGDRLLAQRAKTLGGQPVWSVGIFSLQTGKLSTPLYEVDGASSPAYHQGTIQK